MLKEMNYQEIMETNGGFNLGTFLIGAIIGGMIYDVTKRIVIGYINEPYTRIVTRQGQQYLVRYAG